MSLLSVETSHGTMLCVEPSTMQFVHAPAEMELPPAVLFRASPSFGFLLGGATAEGDASQTRVALLPLRIRAGAAPARCSLVEPLANRLFTAEPAPAPGRPGPMAADRSRAGAWETFVLRPASPPPALVNCPALLELQALAASPPTLAEIVAELDAAAPRTSPAMLRAWLTAMPHTAAALAACFADRPLAAARAAAPSDPWLGTGLASLAAWQRDRDAVASRHVVGPELDFMEDLTKLPAQLGQAACALLRRRVEPRRSACVVATGRNEGIYLLEWIAYHQAIGFEHFFLYGNDNDDGSDKLLAALAASGVITWLDNRLAGPVSPQLKAYAHAFGLLPGILDYQWALVIDMDEFFVFDTRRFGSVQDYLAWNGAQYADAIALNWLMFGTFGAFRFDPARLTTERFTTRFAGVNPHIKTLCRPRHFVSSHAHYPRWAPDTAPVFRDSQGAPYEGEAEFAWSKQPVAEAAWINHYWSKSLDELLCKFSRNRGDMANVPSRTALQAAEDIGVRVLRHERGAGTEQDARIAEACPGLRGAIARLRAIPGVRAAEDQAVLSFTAKLAALRTTLAAIDPDSVAPDTREVLYMLRDDITALGTAQLGLNTVGLL